MHYEEWECILENFTEEEANTTMHRIYGQQATLSVNYKPGDWDSVRAWILKAGSCCHQAETAEDPQNMDFPIDINATLNVPTSFKILTCSWLLWGPCSSATDRLLRPSGLLCMSCLAVVTRTSIICTIACQRCTHLAWKSCLCRNVTTVICAFAVCILLN